ncbi:hypothetical protein PRK78_000336 [Emydomyces testavorans]|uniref:Uncharacterized protein n=1 Tax=Emydomyces testavorans TaxID=2070801 RepID=A0AAF0DAI9_9EURO|nr:hypothetical protein PRK78_000336 [Emydomyces testavorans]
MKSHSFLSRASTLILLLASIAYAASDGSNHGHGDVIGIPKDGFGLKHHHLHRRAAFSPRANAIMRRRGTCEFPSDAGLVAVTPNKANAGWAMSPDQSCQPGNYCPYACPAGMVMAQWDPDATSYSYPKSMNGGLYCDKSGKVSKPFPDKPYCVDASGPVVAKNKAGGVVAFCQTVLPGNEAMLIPTSVNSSAKLAVPDPRYWCSTAAHYYINPPGKDTDTACVWGTKDNPWGNWAAYVAGANMDDKGQTFLKIGWNPIYLEPATPFRSESPSYGVKIECEGGGCNGLPCEIDPSKNGINQMTGSNTNGAGGASFCVVTVPQGSKASVVVFDAGKGNSGDSTKPKEDSKSDKAQKSPEPTTSTPQPTTTAKETSTPTPEPTTTNIVSSTSSLAKTTSTIASTTSTKSSFVTTHTSKAPTLSPHVFVEKPSSSIFRASNSTTTVASATLSPTVSTPPKPGAASAATLSIASLTASFLVVSTFLSF